MDFPAPGSEAVQQDVFEENLVQWSGALFRG